MAEVIASPLVEVLIEKLGSGIWKELELLWGVNNDTEKLRDLLSTISAVLDDAERRSIGDSALLKWLRDLKDATLDADDVVDEFQTEVLQRGIKSHNRIMGKVRDFFFPKNPIAFRYKTASKMKDLRKRFDEIVQVRKDFHLTEGSSSSKRVNNDRETYSCINESEVYGRNIDKVKVIEFLVDMDNDKDVSILPIVGLGGVGKTTLAHLVYNDESIKNHFKLQMWVCVAKDFDVKLITRAVLECVTKEECRLSDIENIQQLLRQQLRDKKFLLVLDDVWNENRMEWERLKPLLGGGKLGNNFIVTTRSDTVASIMGTVDSYRLDVLSFDDCWILFRQRAFGLGREEENPKLVEIGKEIVRKCGGLPLAAKALGSLMGTKRGEVEWLAIKNSEIWRLPEGKDGILPALRLSYDHLPPHVKHCFAYCSLFLKDYEINKLKLIQLWIAEGFIQSSEEEMHAEDIGNQYFNSLLWRSFFQNEVRDIYGNIESYKMHDLVHDLACSVAMDESCMIGTGIKRSVPHGCRYCSVICEDDLSSPILKVAWEARKLRSLIFFAKYSGLKTEVFIRDALSNLIHLRALDLSGTRMKKLPNIVGKLKHLRLLDLSNTYIKALPDSIAGLYNLQSLNLRNCGLRGLPEGIRNISNLRHLDISMCHRLTRMPRGLGRLSNLQTLPLFFADEEPGRTIVELQHLNIRGHLEIRRLYKVKDPMEAMEAKLGAKANLQVLNLCWDRGRRYWRAPSRENVDVEGILDNLQPPSNLMQLTIKDYDGKRFPNWLTKMDPSSSSSFPHLVYLSLQFLYRCESLPPLGQLPSLKYLHICGMDAVRRIGREFYGDDAAATFSSLEYLILLDLPNLEEWFVPERDMFPSLQSLNIAHCPKLTVQPFLPSSIVKLEIRMSNEELLAAGGSLQELSRLRVLTIGNMKAVKIRLGRAAVPHRPSVSED